MRDVCIAIDGTVLYCREDLDGLKEPGARPNVFACSSIKELWESADSSSVDDCTSCGLYKKHSAGIYPGQCADCDEYYTFNF